MQTVRARLGAAIPEDWTWKESLTLLAHNGEANLIFSSEPLDPSVDLDGYANAQGQLLSSEFPGYRQIAFELMPVFGDKQGYLHRFEWSPPDGVPVTQIQLYYVEDSRGYTATATTPTKNAQDAEATLIAMLEQLTLDRASTAAVAASLARQATA